MLLRLTFRAPCHFPKLLCFVNRMASTSSVLPVFFTGKVVHGAGRGGTQLGFPTANVDPSTIQHHLKELEDGVYYGYARVIGDDKTAEPMVMSVGQNLTFADATTKTAEVHILKKYPKDFYDHHMQVAIVGYIRPMRKFDGIDSLIEAINNDIKIAREQFEKPEVSENQRASIFSE